MKVGELTQRWTQELSRDQRIGLAVLGAIAPIAALSLALIGSTATKTKPIVKADKLEARVIRVIPISKPEAPPLPPYQVATADPQAVVPVEPVKPPPPGPPAEDENTASAPARRHYSDICAAHGMRKVERGRGWRCVHIGRR